MSDQQSDDAVKRPKPGRYPLYTSVAVFLVLVVNIVAGKIAVLNGATETVGMLVVVLIVAYIPVVSTIFLPS